jgi:predicted RNA-binding Zn ribbon-like protein
MAGSPNPFRDRGFGASAPWLDFVNSAIWDGFGNFTELLDSPAWLREFLRFWHFRVPSPSSLPQKDARRLRTLLRHIVEKTLTQTKIQPGEIASLNSWLRIPVFPQLVEHQNGLIIERRPAQIGWPSVFAAVAYSFTESLLREQQGRLKICANHDCRWIFVDHTKANVRRWCNDATCGNRDRVRRSRAAKQT